jgi:hypothetical protein
MGGSGSGRRWGSKNTTDDYIQLDVRHLQRKSLLQDGNAFTWKWSRRGEVISKIEIHAESDRIVLSYRSRTGGDDWEDLKYAVELEAIPCHLGGSRQYFRCPALKCGRRVAILYGGRYFVCRHCYNLAYECQREEPHYRALRKAQNLSVRLGGTGCVFDGICRPKGMHGKTYRKLEFKFIQVSRRMNALTAVRFGL